MGGNEFGLTEKLVDNFDLNDVVTKASVVKYRCCWFPKHVINSNVEKFAPSRYVIFNNYYSDLYIYDEKN